MRVPSWHIPHDASFSSLVLDTVAAVLYQLGEANPAKRAQGKLWSVMGLGSLFGGGESFAAKRGVVYMCGTGRRGKRPASDGWKKAWSVRLMSEYGGVTFMAMPGVMPHIAKCQHVVLEPTVFMSNVHPGHSPLRQSTNAWAYINQVRSPPPPAHPCLISCVCRDADLIPQTPAISTPPPHCAPPHVSLRNALNHLVLLLGTTQCPCTAALKGAVASY